MEYKYLSNYKTFESLKLDIKETNNLRTGFQFNWVDTENKFRKDKIIGYMDVFIQGEYAVILGYIRYKCVSFEEKSYGYTFIKMCIDYMLKKGYKILSYNRGRNEQSNYVWEKLSNSYEVIDSTVYSDIYKKEEPCKILIK